MTKKNSRGRCGGCWQGVDENDNRRWFQRPVRLCHDCAEQQDRHLDSELPIAAYLDDIAALTDDDWLDDTAIDYMQEVQTGSTMLPSWAPTELARFVARFNNWRLHGDELCTPDGLRVADRLEDAVDAMTALGWFNHKFSGVMWMKLTGGRPSGTSTYPAHSRCAAGSLRTGKPPESRWVDEVHPQLHPTGRFQSGIDQIERYDPGQFPRCPAANSASATPAERSMAHRTDSGTPRVSGLSWPTAPLYQQFRCPNSPPPPS